MNKLKVAAYCKVSTNHEEQEASLETQISYYGKLIVEHEGWQLVKIYAERASGTQIKKRPEFSKMLKACRQGKVDLILTKSISRFGRNTPDTLKTLYELFNLGVKVYFGDVIMQKSFTEDFLTGKRKKNEGELAMYFIENDYEAIIGKDTFTTVQEMKNKKQMRN